ncbi:uroporphyrinogen-III synthase [Poritiphilus flavus]|uniref:Uroporphyrinogen-III synthase n=1 Tax=Poritiphilus flavus TaxID=2697053 RepID=A0A6L9E837_9FLAO|nr:uroporphyrinogen-III synthase [Poritiphilus flavus]NAS10860.1 uroporphyrinogen-III synthase [Poritiphilus flavus]
MRNVLSTKILTKDQRRAIPSDQYQLVEYDAIHVELIDINTNQTADYHIFTSKNAVRGFLKANLQSRPCFCVGSKTKQFLEENGQKVVKSAKNAQELARFIEKNHKNTSFLFFRGNRSRKELPTILTTAGIALAEIEVYKTELIHKKFEQQFDSLLFFSPSGVESFCSMNSMGIATAYCIGTTTAEKALVYTKNVCVAKHPTIEDVIKLLTIPDQLGTDRGYYTKLN